MAHPLPLPGNLSHPRVGGQSKSFQGRAGSGARPTGHPAAPAAGWVCPDLMYQFTSCGIAAISPQEPAADRGSAAARPAELSPGAAGVAPDLRQTPLFIKESETFLGARAALKGHLPTPARPPALPCRRGMLLRGAAAHPTHEARSSKEARQRQRRWQRPGTSMSAAFPRRLPSGDGGHLMAAGEGRRRRRESPLDGGRTGSGSGAGAERSGGARTRAKQGRGGKEG